MSELMLNDELSWLAFRYAAGEMSPLEADAFEARMLEDLDACEAVARMALLCEAANETFKRPSAPLHAIPVKRRTPRWAIAATLASVAWMIGIGVWFASHSREERRANAEIVGIWSSASADESATVAVEEVDAPHADAVAHGDVVVPDWMLAAVRLENADDDEVMEN